MMLLSPKNRFVVSNLGWVDKSSLWVYDVVKDSVSMVSLGNSSYLSLYPCKDENLFTVLHHSSPDRVRITIHSFDKPADPLLTVEHTGESSRFEGDMSMLKSAPQHYVTFYDPGHQADYYLIAIDNSKPAIQADRFSWFDDSYDKTYQGIVGVIELPSGELIVSIQRDSNPIVYDPRSKSVVRKLSLAGRYGNPRFRLVRSRDELWADDYDTLIKLDSHTLEIKGKQRLQSAFTQTMQFIGDWSFSKDEMLCFVARPYSGDVLAISTENMKTKYVAKTGKQPLEAVCPDGKMVIGRDWKTGDLLNGSLR